MTETRKAVIDANDVAGFVGVVLFVAGCGLMAVLVPLVTLAIALMAVGVLLFLIAWRRA